VAPIFKQSHRQGLEAAFPDGFIRGTDEFDLEAEPMQTAR